MADPPQDREEQQHLRRAMLEGRADWDLASHDLQRLLEHREELTTSDGRQALHNARNAHRLALNKYEDALKQFADCVLNRGA